jgi:hypothetical protein
MSDDITQAEKRQIVKNDTYYSRAQADVGSELGGRYRHLAPASVVGVPQYPQQPPNSPFHHDPTGAEPPLGIDVNEMIPVGTHAEVQASIAASLQKAIEEGSRVARAPDVLPSHDGPTPIKRRV